MSFRLFIYYCAVWGGCAAFFGWIIGRALVVAASDPNVESAEIGQAAIAGMFLGMLVTLGLSLVDSLVGLVESLKSLAVGQLGQIILKIACSVGLGSLGGLIAGAFGQILFYYLGRMPPFLIVGWTFLGLLIGASLGAFDLAACAIRKLNLLGPIWKIIRGAIGGTVGGLVGGTCALFLRYIIGRLFPDKLSVDLWSPSALGFIILGACIGLAIALAQVILKEAWVKVELGFRAGRELILTKPEVTIGRAEACDIGLFGDPQVEKQHALIVLQNNHYELVDKGTPHGTYLNDRRITKPTPLKSGDMIRCGRNVLCFRERPRSKSGA